MNYFVIRLPLTYINAVEARHFFRISSEDSILIILYQNEQSVDIRQIKKILIQDEWRKYTGFLIMSMPVWLILKRVLKQISS